MTLKQFIGWAVMLGIPLGTALLNAWAGKRYPMPATPPQPAPDALEAGEWLLLPFQLIAGLAGLCWCLVGLVVFLAPLAFVVLALLAVMQ